MPFNPVIAIEKFVNEVQKEAFDKIEQFASGVVHNLMLALSARFPGREFRIMFGNGTYAFMVDPPINVGGRRVLYLTDLVETMDADGVHRKAPEIMQIIDVAECVNGEGACLEDFAARDGIPVKE